MTKTPEAQIQTGIADKQPDSAPNKKSARKSIMALSVFALAINGTAAIYTLPSLDITLPSFSGLVAELLPHEKASAPIPDAVVAALKDIQSAQQQHIAALQDSDHSLQQNAALLQKDSALIQKDSALIQKDSATIDSLRKSLTDEQVDVKKISTQLSTLIAKVDLLQNAIVPEITSSIPKGRARARLSGMAHKRMARPLKPVGPISVGGAPLTTAPAQGWTPVQSPEG
ncbi:hypothetical protein [Bradyrhizobium sp.]|uniref:hypothetical protein n=1 Tax=Bradyrhizobium sp. TaxID=376 RepID=UPI003C20F71A